MEIIYRDITTIRKAENNPRTISEEQLQKLQKSIQDNPDYFSLRNHPTKKKHMIIVQKLYSSMQTISLQISALVNGISSIIIQLLTCID